MIRLVTLGSLSLTTDSRPVLVGRRKVLAALAFLVRHTPAPVPRSELTRVFWGDRDDAHAKQSLRQALAELRPILEGGLHADTDTVRLDEGLISLDLAEFEEAVAAERWQDAAGLWGGDFLPAGEVIGGEAWQAWLIGERVRLHEKAARTFGALAAVSLATEDWAAVVDWATRWTEMAPLDESACAHRILGLVNTGRPVDASVCYESFVRRLRTATNEDPSPEFEQLKRSFAAHGRSPRRKSLRAGRLTLTELTQLSGDARTLVEAAAVIGGPADVQTLRTIAELTSHSFRYACDELAEKGIFRELDGGQYDFTSGENRKQVYDVIARDRRQALHRAVYRILSPDVADEAALVVTDEHRRLGEPPRRFQVRPRAVLMAAGVVIVAAIGASWVGRVSRANATELAAGSTILLADGRTGSGDPSMDEALVAAATLGLQQSQHFSLYPRSRASSLIEGKTPSQGVERLDENAARQVAVQESVARVVALDVQRDDSLYRLVLRVIDPRTGGVVGEEHVDAPRRDIVDGLDDLLRRVRSALGESDAALRGSTRPLRVVGSPSIEALSAYAAGMKAAGAGDTATARVEWRRAIALDSSFALVALALANDAYARLDDTEGDVWMERALRHSDRLPSREVARARQLLALRSGNLDEAGKLAEQIAELEPSSESWYHVAAVRLAAHQCEDAIPALTRALTFDSLHTRARLGLAACAYERGDVGAALAAYAVVRRIDSTAFDAPDHAWGLGATLVRAGRFDEAAEVFQRLLTADSIRGLEAMAHLEMYRGRHGDALQHLELASRLVRHEADRALLFDHLVMQAHAFAAVGGRTRASEIIDEAVALASDEAVSPEALFRLGNLMVRIGRVNGAREVLRVLSSKVDPTREEGPWAERLLTGAVRVAERDAAGALTALDRADAPPGLEPFRLAVTADANSLAAEYEAALAAARRLADGWYFGTPAQDEWLRALLRLARVAEAQGDTVAARTAYTRFVDRWKDAELYLVDLAAAQRALQRLGGSPPQSR